MRSILVICFNRPAFTRELFEHIKAARPDFLYVAADAARAGRPEEEALVEEVRDVFENITWPCRVVRDYATENMGCKARIISAYERAFEEVDRAIILEDDVLLRPELFDFCDTILDRYADTPKVTSVSGCSHVRSSQFRRSSYYFSRYPEMWGWAAFRRAMTGVNWNPDPQETAERLSHVVRRPDEPQRWAELLQMVDDGKLDTWDYQFIVDAILKGHLTVIPRVPLSRNRGFGTDSTHTSGAEPFFARPIGMLQSPIRHPGSIHRTAFLDELRSIGTIPPHSKLYTKIRPYAQEVRRRVLREGADLLGQG
jgi:hypothetical protein